MLNRGSPEPPYFIFSKCLSNIFVKEGNLFVSFVFYVEILQTKTLLAMLWKVFNE
jgi:hypothetical protein